jgi:hypothetical protein
MMPKNAAARGVKRGPGQENHQDGFQSRWSYEVSTADNRNLRATRGIS